MKQATTSKLRIIMTSVSLFFLQLVARAQDKIEIDTQEVSSWFQRNWPLVAGGVLLIVLAIIFGRRTKPRSKTTTVVNDRMGNVKKVTTTEVNS